MNINVTAQVFSLTPAIDAHVRGRLTRALSHFDPSVVNVHAYLNDVNGPKGGDDKQVSVRISLRSGRVLLVKSTHSDLYAATERAARGSERAVKRALNKHRQIARRALQKLRGLPTPEPQPA